MHKTNKDHPFNKKIRSVIHLAESKKKFFAENPEERPESQYIQQNSNLNNRNS
jgi:hypothetical protein